MDIDCNLHAFVIFQSLLPQWRRFIAILIAQYLLTATQLTNNCNGLHTTMFNPFMPEFLCKQCLLDLLEYLITEWSYSIYFEIILRRVVRWDMIQIYSSITGQALNSERQWAVIGNTVDHSTIRVGPKWWETASSQRQRFRPLGHQGWPSVVRDS